MHDWHHRIHLEDFELVLAIFTSGLSYTMRQTFRHAALNFPRFLELMLYALSNSPAAPCPPPMHIVTTPYRLLRRSSSRRMVPVNLDPVMPNG